MTAPSSPRPLAYRWVVLGLFMLVAGLSQALWLNFAPLMTLVQAKYGVSEELAGTLVLVFPLVYVLVSVPAGTLTDRRGYRFAIGLGAVLMAAFSLLRINETSFWLLLVAQTGIAVGQPFAVNGISKLVAEWFTPAQGAIATGLGTMGMFVGMAAGMAATPPLVEALGYQGAMIAFAALSVAICAAFVLLAKNHPDAAKATGAVEQQPSLRSLLKNPQLLLLFVVAALGMGFFNGLTTWLEPILQPNGFDAVKAGAIGGVLIVGGIVGAVVVPALSDLLRRRKPFLIGSVLFSVLALVPAMTSHDETVVMVAAAAVGFFFLPAFALLIDMCATVAGEAAAGGATGLLMLFGNGGGVLVIIAMVVVKGDQPTFARAVTLLFVLLAGAIALALGVKETMQRSALEVRGQP